MTEEEPTNVAPIMAERIEQFKATWERHALQCELPPASDPEATMTDILFRKGFPYRHVLQLKDLWGKGHDVARSKFLKIAGGDCLIVLVGNRGPGKTQMATYWATVFMETQSSTNVRYVKCADLIGEIKATWHDGGRKVGTESDVLSKYRRARYLVIDEFHERGGSDWESRCLINLLDHRYDDMLATVLIANLSAEEAKKQINPSILDRANQTGGVIVCDWETYR
jgi:hypothetical protein